MINRFIIFTALLVAYLCVPLYGAASNTSNILHTNQAAIKETFINAGDAKLFCRIAGKGQPVIVIHGGPGLTQDYLLPHMYELAKNNLVIFYDQRGCGNSTGEINTDTINIKSFVNDIDTIRRALNFDKVSVLGHSYGAFLAMNYAIAHPEDVDKLILCNSFPSTSKDYTLFGEEYMKRMSPYQEEIKKITDSQEYKDGNSKTVENFYRLIFKQYCYNPAKADLLNLWMTPTAAVNGAKVYECLRENAIDRPFNLTNDLKKLTLQTLVIHGDADPIPPITARHIHENIPGSKFVLIKNCGHFPYVEDPEAYFRHIREFLNPNIAN